MNVYDKIAAQQKGKENTDAWMVGQQLKDILRADPALEDIVDKDLDVQEMDLAHCAKKIKAHADELHKSVKGNCVCITPDVAEGIIRKFYGLPDLAAELDEQPQPVKPAEEDDNILDFGDFL